MTLTVAATWMLAELASEPDAPNLSWTDEHLASWAGLLGLASVVWLWSASFPRRWLWAASGWVLILLIGGGLTGMGADHRGLDTIVNWNHHSPVWFGLGYLLIGALSLALWRPVRRELDPPLHLKPASSDGLLVVVGLMIPVVSTATVAILLFPFLALIVLAALAFLGPVEGKGPKLVHVRNTRLKMLVMAAIMAGTAFLLVTASAIGCQGVSFVAGDNDNLYGIDQVYRGLTALTGVDWVFDGCGAAAPLAVRLGRLIGFIAVALAALGAAWLVTSPVRSPVHLRFDRNVIAFVGVNAMSVPIINHQLDAHPGRVYVIEADPDAPGLAEVMSRGARHVDGRLTHKEFLDRAIRQWPSDVNSLAELYLLHDDPDVNRRWHEAVVEELGRLLDGQDGDGPYGTAAGSVSNAEASSDMDESCGPIVSPRLIPTRVYVRVDDVRERLVLAEFVSADARLNLVGSNWMVDAIGPMDTAAGQLVAGLLPGTPTIVLADGGEFSLAVLVQLLRRAKVSAVVEEAARVRMMSLWNEDGSKASPESELPVSERRPEDPTVADKNPGSPEISTENDGGHLRGTSSEETGNGTNGDGEHKTPWASWISEVPPGERPRAFKPNILLASGAATLIDDLDQLTSIDRSAASIGTIQVDRSELPDDQESITCDSASGDQILIVMEGDDEATREIAWHCEREGRDVFLLSPLPSGRPNQVRASTVGESLVTVHPTLVSSRQGQSIRSDSYRIEGTWDEAAEFLAVMYNIDNPEYGGSVAVEAIELDDDALDENLRPLVNVVRAIGTNGWTWTTERQASGHTEAVIAQLDMGIKYAEHTDWMKYKVAIRDNYGPEFPHQWMHRAAGRSFKDSVLDWERAGVDGQPGADALPADGQHDVETQNVEKTDGTIRSVLHAMDTFGLRPIRDDAGGGAVQPGFHADEQLFRSTRVVHATHSKQSIQESADGAGDWVVEDDNSTWTMTDRDFHEAYEWMDEDRYRSREVISATRIENPGTDRAGTVGAKPEHVWESASRTGPNRIMTEQEFRTNYEPIY